jgi:hypothetical protein
MKEFSLCAGEKCCPRVRVHDDKSISLHDMDPWAHDGQVIIGLSVVQTIELRDLLNKEFPK